MTPSIEHIDLLMRSDYFDPEYYAMQSQSRFDRSEDAARDYLETGHRRGLDPSREFNAEYYLSHNSDVAIAGLDPFLHFLEHGRWEGRKPRQSSLPPRITRAEKTDSTFLSLAEQIELLIKSGYFDADYYARQSKSTYAGPEDAARDYLESGHRRGYDPSPAFDTKFYLRCNRDVAEAGINPVLHFLSHGSREGRRPRLSSAPEATLPMAPENRVWQDLQHRLKKRTACLSNMKDSVHSVDVIIPVYRGYDDTLACIHSVLCGENRTPFRLLVINDAGPDQHLTDKLAELHHLGLITLMTNPNNLGFVGTVNRGMQESVFRDVILLNSDTEVFGDWIDRMRSQAYSRERVATVTPLSNNATIFSYPFFNESNNQKLDVNFAALDRIARTVNHGTSAVVPTGVGFCFYIRRAAIDEIGLFDTDLFGKGYGEENDFCMRAIEHAWCNLAALDIFVRHTGEVSFGAGASEGKKQGGRRLMTAHPRFDTLVQECIKRDPFKTARGQIDIARFAERSGGRGVLMIEHGWGGGIQRNIADLIIMFGTADVPALICSPATKGAGRSLKEGSSEDYPNLPPFDWCDIPGSAKLLRALNLGHVHIHSLIGLKDSEIAAMRAAIALAGLRYSFTIHDYAPICPRITMIDWGGSYCDSPSPAYCRICIAEDGTRFGTTDITAWRNGYQEVLSNAHRIIVPDVDVVERLLCRVPDRSALEDKIIVRPHPAKTEITTVARSADSSVRTIGIIGAIGQHKGSATLMALCADAMLRDLPLRFVVYGYTNLDDQPTYRNLHITGRYKETEFRRIIDEIPCDIALFLSVWPETFSYTLDYAFHYGIYPVSLDVGAPARRIRETGFGTTVPLGHIANPARINDLLVEVEIDSAAIRPRKWEAGRDQQTPARYYEID